MNRFDNIELARGYFDRIVIDHDTLLVSGWFLLPWREFTSVSVYLDEELAESALPSIREDVGQVLAWIPHARRSGFQFQLPLKDRRSGRIDVIGYCEEQPVARLSTLFRFDAASMPVPPVNLMKRVTGLESADFFKTDGMKSFSDFMFAIRRHREPGSIRRMLDWGCGCGRMTVHFLSDGRISALDGCDIDGEAIAWCRDNLKPGTFARIDAWPPTPYSDATFDLVIGYSVFTHLDRETQKAWLAEIRRITAPGGLFLASANGEFATLFTFPPQGTARMDCTISRPEILRNGIFDATPDPALNGIAPEGYYRGVFQTKEYTIREWSQYFEILEYIERGAANYQDLIVMRRPT